jgi:hypothetical protein
VRAEIENGELRHYRFWHADPADGPRHARRLDEGVLDHINRWLRDGDR